VEWTICCSGRTTGLSVSWSVAVSAPAKGISFARSSGAGALSVRFSDTWGGGIRCHCFFYPVYFELFTD
jgi:hypothetical protein